MTDICVANVATGSIRNLTDTEDRGESSAAWSPDGEMIGFLAHGPDPRVDDDDAGLFVVEAAGGEPLRLHPASGRHFVVTRRPVDLVLGRFVYEAEPLCRERRRTNADAHRSTSSAGDVAAVADTVDVGNQLLSMSWTPTARSGSGTCARYQPT